MYFSGLILVCSLTAGQAAQLQVGAFSREKNVQQRVRLLKDLGVEVKLEQSPEGYTRVRTDELDYQQRIKVVKRLEKKRINYFFVDYIPPPSPPDRTSKYDTNLQFPLPVARVKSRVKSVEGTPYRWGRESPENGFDCSGLLKWLLPHPNLPRTVLGMRNWTKIIEKNQLKPGDFVFFQFKASARPDHVGLYLGNKKFVHASKHYGVILARLEKNYYQQRISGYGRSPVKLVK